MCRSSSRRLVQAVEQPGLEEHVAVGSPYTVQVLPFLLFLNLLIALNWLMFTAIGVHRAASGQLFTYPFTLRASGLLVAGRSH